MDHGADRRAGDAARGAARTPCDAAGAIAPGASIEHRAVSEPSRCRAAVLHREEGEATRCSAEPGRFFGGKGGPGVAERIVSMMPPHDDYIEPFLGSGAVMRRKRPAAQGAGIETNPETVARWRTGKWTAPPGHESHCACGVKFLQAASRDGRRWPRVTMIYIDPPYPLETRRSGHRYTHELTTAQHRRILAAVVKIRCMVIVSSYPGDLYDSALAGWRRVEYQTMTSGGPRTEVLWANFPEPHELHDYRFIGADFRERERIQRTRAAIMRRVARMGQHERAALLEALGEP